MFRRRLGFLLFLVLSASAAIVVRLVDVQLVRGEEFRRAAGEERSREVELPAVRGAIFTADGVPLARDRCSYVVTLVPSRWRERSLVQAVVDLRVLLDAGVSRAVPGAEAPQPASMPRDLRWQLVADIDGEVAALLDLPASVVGAEAARLAERGVALVLSPGGLAIAAEESEARLRTALGILLGRRESVRRRELARFAESGTSLGPALGLTVAGVAERLRSELSALRELGRSTEWPELSGLLWRLDALVDREREWIGLQIDRELRDLVLLDAFGTVAPGPDTLEPERWAELVRSLSLSFRDDAAARAALEATETILSGRLPLPAGSERRFLAESDGAPAVDPLGRCAELGIVDADPERVRTEWFRRVAASPAFDRQRHLDARRERELRNGFRGGRSFLFGRGAEIDVAGLVQGPAGLGAQGFGLTPSFTRDPAVERAVSGGLGLLVGQLTTDDRRLRFRRTLEERLDHDLRGQDGAASIGESGVATLRRAPEHGRSVTTTLDAGYQARLERLLAEAAPAGPAAIAVVDAKSGAILGMATWPIPTEVAGAMSRRISLEQERSTLRRIANRGDGWAAQRLARLRALEDGDVTVTHEAEVLDFALRQPPEWTATRIREVGELLALSPAFHRCIDSPEHQPPGSVFKAITILAGLESGDIRPDTTFECRRDPTREHHQCKNHGPAVGIVQALKKSCNAYCYEVGRRLGTAGLVGAMKRFGLFEEIPGLLPEDPELEADVVAERDPRNLAIGGGSLRCSPVRAAGLAASLARGRRILPWFVPKPGFVAVGDAIGHPANLDLVRHGMREVVLPGGTAGGQRGDGLRDLQVAAKTGTADYHSPGMHDLNQAWFVGYAPATVPEEAEIAFAVVLFHTVQEGADAAPLARRTIEAFGESFPERRWW